MTRSLLLPAAVVLLGLAACEREAPAPEAPPMEPPAQAPVEPPAEPGPTPDSYVGLWAADPAWCENDTGPMRPIRITETRFTGYENQCEIADVQPADGGWTATFTCQAEGMTNVESVSLRPEGERLELSWLGSGQTVTFTRCEG